MSCDKSCANFKTDNCAVWRKDKSAPFILTNSMLSCPHYELKDGNAPAKVTFCDCAACRELRASVQSGYKVATEPQRPVEQQSSLTSDTTVTCVTQNTSAVIKREEIDGRLKLTRIYAAVKNSPSLSTEIPKRIPTALPIRIAESTYDTITPRPNMVSQKSSINQVSTEISAAPPSVDQPQYVCPKCKKPGVLEEHKLPSKDQDHTYLEVRHGYDPRSRRYKRCYLGKVKAEIKR